MAVQLTHRPSQRVEDLAWHLIRSGWLAYVSGSGPWSVPSENTAGRTYSVTREDEAFTCSCQAGDKGWHCKHVTIIQVLTGLCAQWSPREGAQLPAAPEAPSIQTAQAYETTDGAMALRGTGCGVLGETWQKLCADLAPREALTVVREALRLILTRAGSGTCALCANLDTATHAPLTPYGRHSLVCRNCGFIVPAPAQTAASAAA